MLYQAIVAPIGDVPGDKALVIRQDIQYAFPIGILFSMIQFAGLNDWFTAAG